MRNFLLFICFGLLCACDGYERVHRYDGQGSLSDHCLGVKKSANYRGFLWVPGRGKNYSYQMRTDDDVEKAYEVKIRGIRSRSDSHLKYIVRQADKCENSENRYGLRVVDMQKRSSGECLPAPSVRYLPTDMFETRSFIKCVAMHAVLCRLSVARKGWAFELLIPVDEIQEWSSIREDFFAYIDQSFDDLGEC